jgi:uncharacterized membrane protein
MLYILIIFVIYCSKVLSTNGFDYIFIFAHIDIFVVYLFLLKQKVIQHASRTKENIQL